MFPGEIFLGRSASSSTATTAATTSTAASSTSASVASESSSILTSTASKSLSTSATESLTSSTATISAFILSQVDSDFPSVQELSTAGVYRLLCFFLSPIIHISEATWLKFNLYPYLAFCILDDSGIEHLTGIWEEIHHTFRRRVVAQTSHEYRHLVAVSRLGWCFPVSGGLLFFLLLVVLIKGYLFLFLFLVLFFVLFVWVLFFSLAWLSHIYFRLGSLSNFFFFLLFVIIITLVWACFLHCHLLLFLRFRSLYWLLFWRCLRTLTFVRVFFFIFNHLSCSLGDCHFILLRRLVAFLLTVILIGFLGYFCRFNELRFFLVLGLWLWFFLGDVTIDTHIFSQSSSRSF